MNTWSVLLKRQLALYVNIVGKRTTNNNEVWQMQYKISMGSLIFYVSSWEQNGRKDGNNCKTLLRKALYRDDISSIEGNKSIYWCEIENNIISNRKTINDTKDHRIQC